MGWKERFEERTGRPPNDAEVRARDARKEAKAAASEEPRKEPPKSPHSLTLHLVMATGSGVSIAYSLAQGVIVSRKMLIHFTIEGPTTTLEEIKQKATNTFGGACALGRRPT